MIKRILTFIKTVLAGIGLLLALCLASCSLEPSKESTRTDIVTNVLKDCNISEWYELIRQGSFESDDEGRHRIYRCFVDVEVEQNCSVARRMEYGEVPDSVKYMQLIPGRQQLIVYLDYLETEGDWRLVQVVVSGDASGFF